MRVMGDTALVIGGGFAGMLAARVLADFFRRVIVFEKDLLADDPRPRRGVPQGPHIHGPLLGTIHILSELFPRLPSGAFESKKITTWEPYTSFPGYSQASLLNWLLAAHRGSTTA